MNTNAAPVNNHSCLFKKLDQGLSHRLTLLTAPKGSGKSGLLANWIQRASAKAAIIRLNRDDASPLNIVRRIYQYCPNVHVGIESASDSPETQFINLINDLCDIPEELCIVLDEYQPSPESDALLNMLIEYLPPLVHIYISSETSPDILSIPRLRVRRQLLELTLSDCDSAAEQPD